MAQCPECDGTYDGYELCQDCRNKLEIQIGWWEPVRKRFCYDDEKQNRADLYSSYTVPVYVETAVPGPEGDSADD